MKTKILEEFKKIKDQNFIDSNRKHNTGIGKTFEDLLGIKENNTKEPDYEGFEIKTQRLKSKSKITLVTKSPTEPKNANSYLKANYGKPHKVFKEVNIIHFSTFGNDFRPKKSNIQFKLDVNRIDKQIHLIVKNVELGSCDNSIFYTFEDLMTSTQKLNNLFLVIADAKTINGKEEFHFSKAKVYENFIFENFLNAVEDGRIQFDLRIGVYATGKPHDHGSGFRIHRDNLKDLYSEHFDLE
ncbi:MAG: MvaI/BcnI family restriction endonuclease [Candidatus Kapabacteria bacterium]|nr:MvaI/BcnI family restriction endonuclease [Candidatus Kapabacteria bacterium]